MNFSQFIWLLTASIVLVATVWALLAFSGFKGDQRDIQPSPTNYFIDESLNNSSTIEVGGQE